jgi:hypothetical protein
LGYGAAVVDGSEDLSVMVEQVGTSQVSAYSGVQANPLGDAQWATTGGSLALPYVYRAYSGYTSSIRLLNTSAQAANVYLLYYDRNGNYVLASRCASTTGGAECLERAAQHGERLLRLGCDPVQPAAGRAERRLQHRHRHQHAGGRRRHVGLSALHHAQLRRLELLLRRAQPGATRPTASPSPTTTAPEPPWNHNQSPPTPCGRAASRASAACRTARSSARITSTSGRPFVLAINQSQVSAGKHMSYNGSQQASRVVSLPVLRRNHSENGRTWSSGFQVQNAGDGYTCFTVSYFTPAGASIAGQSSGCLNPGYAQGFYLPNVTVNRHDGRLVVGAGDGGRSRSWWWPTPPAPVAAATTSTPTTGLGGRRTLSCPNREADPSKMGLDKRGGGV